MNKTQTILLKNINSIVSANHQGLSTFNSSFLFLEDGVIKSFESQPADIEIDCNGKMITPGFIDAHTHPVFYDTRHKEFLLRMKGASYEEIAQNGGGIVSSREGVMNTPIEYLVEKIISRMDQFIRYGTTTIEAKSGYGLDLDNELKSLSCIDMVNKKHPIDLVATFMGAHAIPSEYKSNKKKYIDLICNNMIPAVAEQGIALYNDVFCEKNYFSLEETRKIVKTGKDFGLIPRLHVDEFEDIGGVELAIEMEAASVDHLMATSKESIKALAQNDVIATLLPGTTFFLGKDKYAPARQLIDSGASIALATDFNPGSSHLKNMSFIIILSLMKMNLSVEEAFIASTFNAAKSLQLEDSIGSIEIGKKADLIIWNIDSIGEIPYHFMDAPIQKVIKSGKIAFEA